MSARGDAIWLVRACALVLALLAFGCTSRARSDGASRTTGGLAITSDPFHDDAFRGKIADAWKRWGAEGAGQGMKLGARLPRTAEGAIEIGLATREEAAHAAVNGAVRGDFTLAFTHEGLAAAEIASSDAGVRYADVAPATDLLVVATDARVEWFYRLRDPSAPTRFALHVDLPPGLPRVNREADGALAFVDTHGRTRLRMPRPYAVDAHGRRRDLELAWDAATSRLALTLDARGLEFPLLVDPAVEHPLWQKVATAASAPPSSPASLGAATFDSFHDDLIVETPSTTNMDTWRWDGTTWSVTTANGPLTRNGAAMTFDSVRNRAVLFGGTSSGGLRDDTWEWDGTTWTEVTTVSAAPARYDAAIVFDAGRARTLLFGGSGTTTYDDTWEWDGTLWHNMNPATSPTVRGSVTMSYDLDRAEVILFGGESPNYPYSLYNDTWAWNGTTWAQRTPATHPPVRAQAMSTYDAVRHRTVLFGGLGVNTGVSLADTWTWDGTNWTQLHPTTSPSARWGGTLKFDAARATSVLFGGTTGNGAPYLNDLWEWDGTNWTQTSAASTGVSQGNAMVYDSTRGKCLLYAGAYSPTQLWTWDGSVWSQLSTPTTPDANYWQSFVFDSARGHAVLWGGFDNHLGQINTTWEWDGTNWMQMAPATSPSLRQGQAMGFDAARGKTILFGGNGSSGALGDTWQWDGTNWVELSPPQSPSARSGVIMAYDSARARLVLVGGGADTWEWNGTTWAETAATGAPTLGIYWGMDYDAVRAKMVLFKGYSADPTDATWEYDGTSWTNPGTSGPAGTNGALAYDAAHGTIVLQDNQAQTWLYYSVGGACTTTSTCDLGACTDGVCCAQAQCGTCQACNQFGSEGICTSVATGTSDPDSCAAPRVCAASGACTSAQGTACAADADCVTGHCVDGACCDSVCDGACQACSMSRGLGENGTCAFAPEGTAGRTSCANGFVCDGRSTTCPVTCADDKTCAPGLYCDATGACVAQKAQGATCDPKAGGDCLDANCRVCAPVGNASVGSCVDGVCCDTPCDTACAVCNAAESIGTCTSLPIGMPGTPSCAPNVCNGMSTACADTCSSDRDCAALAYCDATTMHCVSTAPPGTACVGDKACASGFCVQGVCCNTTCGAPDTGDAGSDGGASSVCAIGICDNSNGFVCRLPASSDKVCRSASCSEGTQTFVATCNGLGDCGDLQTRACAPFACGATECKTTCATDADCAADAHCNTTTKACVVVSASCSSDMTSVVAMDGTTTTSCAPYVCRGAACLTRCSSVSECASGYECAASGACVAIAGVDAAVPASSGGCSCGIATRRAGPTWWLFGASIAIALGRRARRRRARRGECAFSSSRTWTIRT